MPGPEGSAIMQCRGERGRVITERETGPQQLHRDDEDREIRTPTLPEQEGTFIPAPPAPPTTP